MSDPCAFDGCKRLADERSAFCAGHRKQREQGRPMTALREIYKSPWQLLSDAALAYADADGSDREAWRRARERLRIAAERYVQRVRTSR